MPTTANLFLPHERLIRAVLCAVLKVPGHDDGTPLQISFLSFFSLVAKTLRQREREKKTLTGSERETS